MRQVPPRKPTLRVVRGGAKASKPKRGVNSFPRSSEHPSAAKWPAILGQLGARIFLAARLSDQLILVDTDPECVSRRAIPPERVDRSIPWPPVSADQVTCRRVLDLARRAHPR